MKRMVDEVWEGGGLGDTWSVGERRGTKALRSFASSLRVVVMWNCVVSGECWAIEVIRVLSVVARVVGWFGARLVRRIRVIFLGSLGVGLGGIEEEVVDSEDSFELWKASVLVKLHRIDS